MDMNILQTEEATLVDLDSRLAGEFLQIMEKYVFTEDVRLLDGGSQLGRLTLLGPRAAKLLAKVWDARPAIAGECSPNRCAMPSAASARRR